MPNSNAGALHQVDGRDRTFNTVGQDNIGLHVSADNRSGAVGGLNGCRVVRWSFLQRMNFIGMSFSRLTCRSSFIWYHCSYTRHAHLLRLHSR